MIKLFTDISAKLSPDLLNVLNVKSKSSPIQAIENKHLQSISSNANVKLISSGETCELVGDLNCIIDAHTALSLFLKENYFIESDVLHSEEGAKIENNEVSENSLNSNVQVNRTPCDDNGLIDIKTEPEQNNTNRSVIPDPIVFSFRLNDFSGNYESELSPHSTGDPQKLQEVDSAKVSRETIPKESEEAGEELISTPGTEIKDTKEELTELLQGKSEKINSVETNERFKRQTRMTTKMRDYLTHRDKNTRKITLKAPVTKNKEMQPTDSSEMDLEYKVTDNERDNHPDDETDTGTDDDDDEWDTHLQSDHDSDDSDYIPDESENAFEMDKPVIGEQMKKKSKENSSKGINKCKQSSETEDKNVHEEKVKNAEDICISDWFCEKCDTYFPSKSKWKNHSTTHQPQTFEERIGIQPIDEKAKDIPCPEGNCKYVARGKRRLIEHYTRIHGVKNLQCSHCEAKFSLRYDLMRHQKSHGAPKHYCKQCGKFYKCRSVYLKHLKSHEENYIQPKFTCETCGKSFTSKYALNLHVRSVHLGINKSYLCATCGKSFSTKTKYVRHTNAHLHVGICRYV